MKIYENVIDLFLDGEIWKDIEGYSGDYQISNYGRVKSFKRYINGQILKQDKNNSVYLCIRLYKNNKNNKICIHILIFESFNSYKLKENECIHHIDKNPENNNLENLKLMTKFEHLSLHMSGENHPNFGKHHSEKTRRLISRKKIGSKRPGEKSGNHILTEKDIIEIWKYLDEDILTQKEIANMFNVKSNTISKIKNRKIWKHIL